MTEYVIEWSGIGSDVTEMVQSDTPPWKVTKEIRHARLREPIVRCRDCKYYQPKEGAMLSCKFEYRGFTQWKLAEPEGFCKWAIRRDA